MCDIARTSFGQWPCVSRMLLDASHCSHILLAAESIFSSRVEGRGSYVEGRGSRVNVFFRERGGGCFLFFAVGSISAAQSSPIYMFLPDLVKCSLT